MLEGKKRSGVTRDRILEIAEILIAQQGVNGFTLDDIAAPLEIRAPSIYKHFRSRDDVLAEVSKRYISALSEQFVASGESAVDPWLAVRRACEVFVKFHCDHPAYVRLSFVDFAMPAARVEYLRRAAGGTFRENFRSGPLAAMHRRLGRLLNAGVRAGQFRKVSPVNVYRVLKSYILISLVFPDDHLKMPQRNAKYIQRIQDDTWDLVSRYLGINFDPVPVGSRDAP